MSKQISEVFRKPTTRIKSIAFHPTNPIFITAHHCGTVYMWNYLYQQITAVLREHTGSVRVVKIHPAGELFATAGDDKVIRIWNYKTRCVAHKLRGHTDYVRSVDFHPTRPWIVSGSDDCTIKIWDFYSGKMICSSSGHTHYVMAVLFADSTHIITASLDHSMAVWNCSNLFEKKKFMVPDVILTQTIDAHERGVNCLCVKDDEVMSGSDDREVRIWKYDDENLILEKSLYNHEGNVTCVYCSDEAFYGGGEDGYISIFRKGKSKKINAGSRVWCLSGRSNYVAAGTDDGLIVFRSQDSLVSACDEKHVFYLSGNTIMRHNFRQSAEYCKVRGDVQRLILEGSNLVVQYSEKYEVLLNGDKKSDESGCVVYHRNCRYVLKGNELYKDDELFRSGISGVLYSGEEGIFVVSNKSLTYICGDQEAHVTFNFTIREVKTSEGVIAVFGANKILLLDQKLCINHTISELVEITGGLFYDSILVYTTLKQVKFFYEDHGILQSIDMYCKPICVHDGYLLLLSHKGIEKILLNLSEIRFRRAVLNDENILSVIEAEQLPGLSPLEYLIQKGRGGIALPYIKDSEKRFELFLSENSFDEAYKLCENSKMYSCLAQKALEHGNYDMAESCFRKSRDHHNLFFLFLSTKQFDKMKDLEGEEIENMVKIVLEDRSILPVKQQSIAADGIDYGKKEPTADSYTRAAEKTRESSQDLERDVGALSIGKAMSPAEQPESSMEDVLSDNATLEDNCETVTGASRPDEELGEDASSSAGSACLDLSNTNDASRKTDEDEERKQVDEEDQTSTGSAAKTDCATMNDSDFHSQLFDLSDISSRTDDREVEAIYKEALQLTTDGRFSKAIDSFKNCMCAIALKIGSTDDFSDLREKIGNYLLGLHIERARRATDDPVKNIQMSVFFSNLALEDTHKTLAKNLAMTTCFKHGNVMTAKEIAKEYPKGKNAKRILGSEEKEDRYKVRTGYICYDTMEVEQHPRECALCHVKSKEGEKCRACEIGILQ